MKFRSVFFLTAAVIAVSLYATAAWTETRWSEQKANSWYRQQPWLVGSNYVPKSAINQLEMWQEATFNPAEIDQELTWAERMGMNTMRVFLHDLLWQQDAAGFQKRINQFLTFRPGMSSCTVSVASSQPSSTTSVQSLSRVRSSRPAYASLTSITTSQDSPCSSWTSCRFLT